MAAFAAGRTVEAEEIISRAMKTHTSLRWAVTQGLWSFGTASIADFVEKTKGYTVKGVAEQIRCSCLVMEAEADMFFAGQPQQVYDALRSPKHLLRFTKQDGAENHCQSGALATMHQAVFDWLDEELGSSAARITASQ